MKVDQISEQPLEIAPINEARSEKGIFECFYVKEILTNISAVKSHHNDDGLNLNLRTAFLHNKTGQKRNHNF